MDRIPISYQEIMEYFIAQSASGKVNPYNLRRETITRIEQITQRPLLCYVARTDSMMRRIDVPNYINDEEVRERLKIEGPSALTAYMPLLAKYDLHLLEICKSALELSQELVRRWLSQYMFHCDQNDDRVIQCVEFFSSFDIHKSHGRSIDRNTAREKGLVVIFDEEIMGLPDLLRSLSNQYKWLFDNFPVVKIVENGHGKSNAIFLEMQPSTHLTSTPENMRGSQSVSSESFP